MRIMGKKDMVLALIEHYSNGNKAQFASLLGITPQGLSTWIKRGIVTKRKRETFI